MQTVCYSWESCYNTMHKIIDQQQEHVTHRFSCSLLFATKHWYTTEGEHDAERHGNAAAKVKQFLHEFAQTYSAWIYGCGRMQYLYFSNTMFWRMVCCVKVIQKARSKQKVWLTNRDGAAVADNRHNSVVRLRPSSCWVYDNKHCCVVRRWKRSQRHGNCL